MGHLSSTRCSHKQHIYYSTNKHSLSQDGSSDRNRQKMGHLSSILCSHKHHTHPITRCGSCQGKQEPSKRCPTNVPYSTLNGVGATSHNTLSLSHAQDTSVLLWGSLAEATELAKPTYYKIETRIQTQGKLHVTMM